MERRAPYQTLVGNVESTIVRYARLGGTETTLDTVVRQALSSRFHFADRPLGDRSAAIVVGITGGGTITRDNLTTSESQRLLDLLRAIGHLAVGHANSQERIFQMSYTNNRADLGDRRLALAVEAEGWVDHLLNHRLKDRPGFDNLRTMFKDAVNAPTVEEGTQVSPNN